MNDKHITKNHYPCVSFFEVYSFFHKLGFIIREATYTNLELDIYRYWKYMNVKYMIIAKLWAQPLTLFKKKNYREDSNLLVI